MCDLSIPAGMTGRAEVKNLPYSSGLHFAPIVFPNFKCSADAVIMGNRYIVSKCLLFFASEKVDSQCFSRISRLTKIGFAVVSHLCGGKLNVG